jgi:hypothetical protein
MTVTDHRPHTRTTSGTATGTPTDSGEDPHPQNDTTGTEGARRQIDMTGTSGVHQRGTKGINMAPHWMYMIEIVIPGREIDTDLGTNDPTPETPDMRVSIPEKVSDTGVTNF